MRPFDVDPTQGVYGISVAADLVGMDPQSLRLYERCGLLEPARTDGGTRRYSSDDLARLERIGELLTAGLNLAGIAMVLHLETDNAHLRAQLGLTETTPAATPPAPSLRTHKPTRGGRGPQQNPALAGHHRTGHGIEPHADAEPRPVHDPHSATPHSGSDRTAPSHPNVASDIQATNQMRRRHLS